MVAAQTNVHQDGDRTHFTYSKAQTRLYDKQHYYTDYKNVEVRGKTWQALAERMDNDRDSNCI